MIEIGDNLKSVLQSIVARMPDSPLISDYEKLIEKILAIANKKEVD